MQKLHLERLIHFSAWGHYMLVLLIMRRNGWNWDAFTLKLCQGKEGNIKSTDTHKTVRKWFCNPLARHLPGKGNALVRSVFPALTLLVAKAAAYIIEIGCQLLHISTFLMPCRFPYSWCWFQ